MGTFALISAILGIVLSAASIGTSVAQNQKQIQSNKEQNQQAIEQADKAYQRSTPSNQIAELMKAGFTDVQARSIVSSSGSAATYTAPSLVGSQAGVDMSGVLNGMAGLGSGVNQLGQFAVQDRQQDNGGLIGSYLAESSIGTISNHMDELPTSATTLTGFLKWAHSDEAPNWASSLVGSEDWKKCLRNIQGNKALRSFFSETSQIGSTDLNLVRMGLDNDMAAIHILLGEEQYTQEQLNTTALEIQTQLSLDTAPLVTQSKLTELRMQLEKFSTDEQLWSDPAYKIAYLASMLGDRESQAILAACMKSIYTGEYNWLQNPDHASMVGIYSALNKVGLTSNMVGTVFAVAEASGVPITDAVRKFFEPTTSGLLSIVEDAGQVVGAGVDWVNNGIKWLDRNTNDQALLNNARLILKKVVNSLPTGEAPKSVVDIVDAIYHSDQ